MRERERENNKQKEEEEILNYKRIKEIYVIKDDD